MVSPDQVRASNAKLPTLLPPGLVGVFAGATSGIGETVVKAFAKHTSKPKIYYLGRSKEAGERIAKELKELNPGGQYVFISTDLSLLRNVDQVCRDIEGKESAVNVLYMSQGTMRMSGETDEGLRYMWAVTYYSRMRMIANLLPLLEKATSLRRVVTTMAGTMEGVLHTDQISTGKVPFRDVQGHTASLITLALDAFARKAPTVSFIHDYPGPVKTNLIRPEDGIMMQAADLYFRFKFRNVYVPFDECGDRHAFLCTSGMYPSKQGQDGNGAVLEGGMNAMAGIDGVVGSGVYSVSADGQPAPQRVVELLGKYRKDGVVDIVWADLEQQFKRATARTV